jgi:predicted secreted protein
MRSILAGILLVSLLLVPAHLPADGEENALLEGLVLTTDGNPASGTRITVWDGRESRRAVTDAAGKFVIPGLRPGSVFAVRFSPQKFDSVRMDGFRVPEKGNLYLSMEYGTMQRGRRHTVIIPSNPSTGYEWSLLDHGTTSVVNLRERSMETPDETPGRGMAGRGGRELWTFESVGRGNTLITLGYRRPWETGVSPLRYHVVALAVR